MVDVGLVVVDVGLVVVVGLAVVVGLEVVDVGLVVGVGLAVVVVGYVAAWAEAFEFDGCCQLLIWSFLAHLFDCQNVRSYPDALTRRIFLLPQVCYRREAAANGYELTIVVNADHGSCRDSWGQDIQDKRRLKATERLQLLPFVVGSSSLRSKAFPCPN